MTDKVKTHGVAILPVGSKLSGYCLLWAKRRQLRVRKNAYVYSLKRGQVTRLSRPIFGIEAVKTAVALVDQFLQLVAAGACQLGEGKNAIVTGGSQGIGTAASLILAEEGANVCLTYRKHQEEAEKIN